MTDPFSLHGRVALVTGGHRGLGLAIARSLGRAGADLVLNSRNADGLAAAAELITDEAGVAVHTVALDLADRANCAALVERAEQAAGPVDIVVANAGVSFPEEVSSVSDEHWDQTLAVNLSAAMSLTRAAAPAMVVRGWGRFIYLSSTFGEVSVGGRAAYSASKAGLRGLARSAAIDLGHSGVTVNCLAPGPFTTEMTEVTTPPEVRHEYSAMTALGRWGAPDELGGPAVLLASDAGSYITGTTLFVDGGYTAR
ncbi:SDR family NAD(P)-dependent oxidoreductase [Gordonia sp. CPCC 205515]|uniref:SDR family NAD(P)-dependent oxidoreductase n=1 Tax=Gordonia sp. CPCC 205515 TaxID=3140791 RepID=UPI003AF3A389